MTGGRLRCSSSESTRKTANLIQIARAYCRTIRYRRAHRMHIFASLYDVGCGRCSPVLSFFIFNPNPAFACPWLFACPSLLTSLPASSFCFLLLPLCFYFCFLLSDVGSFLLYPLPSYEYSYPTYFIMDPFIVIQPSGILVCSLCKHACLAKEVTTHLRSKHKNLGTAARSNIVQAVS